MNNDKTFNETVQELKELKTMLAELEKEIKVAEEKNQKGNDGARQRRNHLRCIHYQI